VATDVRDASQPARSGVTCARTCVITKQRGAKERLLQRRSAKRDARRSAQTFLAPRLSAFFRLRSLAALGCVGTPTTCLLRAPEHAGGDATAGGRGRNQHVRFVLAGGPRGSKHAPRWQRAQLFARSVQPRAGSCPLAQHTRAAREEECGASGFVARARWRTAHAAARLVLLPRFLKAVHGLTASTRRMRASPSSGAGGAAEAPAERAEARARAHPGAASAHMHSAAQRGTHAHAGGGCSAHARRRRARRARESQSRRTCGWRLRRVHLHRERVGGCPHALRSARRSTRRW
jgi:hypothetical protein